ncbi:hypothetical protein QBC32DRAFT_9856 [Pseudoneurospora amorphoporcata]|uniref:Uncharacterized protein n=1 Tax=Pseudoneurospora amorphoporcata TaxID=241081 RepID=A0AAN6P3R9_9PEZI|nr:hypothetical protein QBC32DRAFT_9856 [Pseudoneurospora amorphoporcata]
MNGERFGGVADGSQEQLRTSPPQGHDSIDGDVLHPGNKKLAGDGVHSEGCIVSIPPQVFIDAVDGPIESGEWDATYTTAYTTLTTHSSSPPNRGRLPVLLVKRGKSSVSGVSMGPIDRLARTAILADRGCKEMLEATRENAGRVSRNSRHFGRGILTMRRGNIGSLNYRRV